MSQRRSRNRRLSARRSSNVSGILDDNTNVIDGNDPLWYDRSIIRPSTSLVFTRNASTILDPDSNINASQLSEKWYNNLSRSDSSKLMEEAVKKNIDDRLNDSSDSTVIDPATESESDQESQKRRANFRANQRKINKSDKSNVFLKALEKTTDSHHTRNFTFQLPEGNESESTNDDSKTIKKLRPRVFKTNKHSKENASNFDDLFYNDSASEQIQVHSRNTRSSLKRKSKDISELIATPEVAQKLSKSRLGKLSEADTSSHTQTNNKTINKFVNITQDKTVLVTPVKELRSRSIVSTPTKENTPRKSSQRKSVRVAKQSVVDKSVDTSTSITENVQKKRAALFSQENKDKTKNSLFDDALEDDEDEPSPDSQENKLVINMAEEDADETNEKNNEGDESESSSIPKSIRRTRSRSLFTERKSSDESENEEILESQNRTGTQQTKNNENENSQRTVPRLSSVLANISKNQSKLQNKSVGSKSTNSSSSNKLTATAGLTEEQHSSSSSSPKIFDTSKKPHPSIIDESSDEEIFDLSKSHVDNDTQNNKTRKSQNQSQAQKLSRVLRQSKSMSKSANKSAISQSEKSSRKSKSTLNADDDNDEQSDSDEGSPEVPNKSRSRLFRRTTASGGKNDFEEALDTENNKTDKSQNQSQVQKSSRTSRQSKNLSKSANKSAISQSEKSSRKSKSTLNADDDNDEQSNSDEGSPEVPNKSRSRLFRRTKASGGENTFKEALDTEINQSILDESSDQEIFNVSKTDSNNTKNNKTDKSQNQSQAQKLSRASRQSKSVSKSVNQSAISQSEKSSRKSKSALHADDDNDEHSDNEEGSPEIPNKSRSRIFRKSKTSGDENAFEKALDTEENQSNVNESSDDEGIFNVLTTASNKTQNNKKDESQNRSQAQKSSRMSKNVSKSLNKSASSQAEKSFQARKSKSALNTDDDNDEEVDIEVGSPEIPNKSRSRLFRKIKTSGDENAFEKALDTEENQSNVNESSDDEGIFNVLTTASNKTQNNKKDESQNRSQAQKSSRMSKNVSKSLNKSASSQAEKSFQARKSKSALNTDDDNDEEVDIEVDSAEIPNKSRPRLFRKSKTSGDENAFEESSDDEKIFKVSMTDSNKTQFKAEKSENQSQAQKFSRISTQSKSVSKSLNQSVSSQAEKSSHARKSKSALNTDYDNNDEGSLGSPILSNKSRSRLFRRNKVSDGGNVFDKILETDNSTINENSKTANASRSARSSPRRKSSRAPNDSHGSIDESGKNRSPNASGSTRESTRRDSRREQSEDETSTIPQHIRRTRSRLFPRPETAEDEAFDDVSDRENESVHRSHLNDSPTSSRSISALREAAFAKPSPGTFKKPRVLLQRLSSIESLKENQNQNRQIDGSHKLPIRIKSDVLLNRSKEALNRSRESGTEALSRNSSESLTEKASETGEGSSARKSKGSQVGVEGSTTGQRSQGSKSGRSSVETSSDGTIGDGQNQNKSASARVPEKSPTAAADVDDDDDDFDDLLHTPNPAQSTLNPSGKPVTRITQFSFRHSVINESEILESPELRPPASKGQPPAPVKSRTPIPAPAKSRSPTPTPALTKSRTRSRTPIPPPALTKSRTRSQTPIPTPAPAEAVAPDSPPDTVQENTTEEEEDEELKQDVDVEHDEDVGQDKSKDVDVDVMDDSDDGDYPLLTRELNDIPYEAEKTTYVEEEIPFLSAGASKSKSPVGENVSTIEESVWTTVKKKTDALKLLLEAQQKHHDEAKREREREKARIDARLKKIRTQREAELKKKNKKPVHKVYYVNGKIYKQPKLPRPKQWATDRLYKYLWKCMEPKFGSSTRFQSEKFVLKLSSIFTVIIRRKKYMNYKAELDDLLLTMAKHNIIKDRYEFYRFCSEFMPYSFRIKVVPMMLPGNTRNIPFEPELVRKPIWDGRNDERSDVSESESESKSKSNSESENKSKSNSESESKSKSNSESESE